MNTQQTDIYQENTYKQSPSERVTALIVTYNRKELLEECLDAILSQTFPVNKIVIIDNASTDGTLQMLKGNNHLENPRVSYKRTKRNIGGAGGFYEGLKYATKEGCDFIWMMDDDTIPTEDCLKNLIYAYRTVKKDDPEHPVSFMASCIYGIEGEFMNPPAINMEPSDNGYEYWYEFLGKSIVSIKSSTFVSILINKQSILRCGYPCKDFFIWGDDTEYTTRLTTFYGEAFLAGNSIAIHKRENAAKLNIINETDPGRIKLYRYYYRNQLIYRHYYKENYLGNFLEMIRGLRIAVRHLKYKPYGKEYAKVILQGTWDGIMQYKKFKDYINTQIET